MHHSIEMRFKLFIASIKVQLITRGIGIYTIYTQHNVATTCLLRNKDTCNNIQFLCEIFIERLKNRNYNMKMLIQLGFKLMTVGLVC